MRPSSSATPGRAIELRDVEVRVGERAILHDVQLRIVGGLTAVIGPSGGGKTTLLRLVNRLDVPSAGAVFLDGVDLAHLEPLALRRRVAMVFQRPLIFPGTVRENLAVANPDTSTRDMTEALTRMGLSVTLLDQDAETLSGGEGQRLALARALLNDPEVLLADEVTSSLDRESAASIEQLLRELASDGMTILAVTHDATRARMLADRIVVLVDGTVGAVGTAEELERSDDAAVRAAMGAHG